MIVRVEFFERWVGKGSEELGVECLVGWKDKCKGFNVEKSFVYFGNW